MTDIFDEKTKHSGDSMFGFSLPDYNFTVDIPSKGLYYKEDHPLYHKEYLEIKMVTGKEEAILTNKDYIRKGIVLDKFLQSLFVDRRLVFPEVYADILLADKFAILVAARNSAYSTDYKATVKCPKCKKDVLFGFDLSKVTHKLGFEGLKDEEKASYTKLNHNCFRLKLPHCQLNMSFKLSSVREESEMIRKAKRMKEEDENLSFKEQFIDSLVDIEGNTTKEAKEYFLDKVPAIDLLYIRVNVEKINPSALLEQNFTCPSCEHEQPEFEVPITQNFLFPHLKIPKY